MKKIAVIIIALLAMMIFSSCSMLVINPGGASSDDVSSVEIGQPESSSAPEPKVMDPNYSMDYCLRMYNHIHAIAGYSSAEELTDEYTAELEALLAEIGEYEASDEKSTYTIAMAAVCTEVLGFANGSANEETLAAAVEASNNAYNAMVYGLRQELKHVKDSEWTAAANILAQK